MCIRSNQLSLIAAGMAAFLFAVSTVDAAESIEVKVTVPDSAWKLEVVEVREVKGELWVLSKVSRDPEAMGAQVITELKQAVAVDPEGRVVKHYVLGKTWNLENEEGCRFIANDPEHKEFEKAFRVGKLLYPKL